MLHETSLHIAYLDLNKSKVQFNTNKIEFTLPSRAAHLAKLKLESCALLKCKSL